MDAIQYATQGDSATTLSPTSQASKVRTYYGRILKHAYEETETELETEEKKEKKEKSKNKSLTE